MVGSLFFSFRFWATLIPLAFSGLLFLLHHLTRLRRLATVQVCGFLRGADVATAFSVILIHSLISKPDLSLDSLRCHRVRLHQAREFMLAIVHDMTILMAWSEGALRMELVEKPWEKNGEVAENSDQFVAGHRALLAAAAQFRHQAHACLWRIYLALLFTAHQRSLALASAAFENLGRNCIGAFLSTYAKVFKAVVEVTSLYDDDLPEEFLKALFKLNDPARDIQLWRNAGIILNTPILS